MVFNGTETTEGFDAFDMSVPGYYNVYYGASKDDKTVETAFTVVAMADRTTIANGDFEAGNLAGWTILSDAWAKVEGQYPGVISAVNYWGEELPYNQAGDFHLDGWNTGIGEPEGWAIRSTNFTLSGSGFISVRMGGAAAAVKVFTADGTLVGYYKQTRFNDAKLVREGSKYFVEIANERVELDPEKEARLLNNDVQSQDVTLGVRPEHTDLSENGGIAGKVDVAEMMGSSVHLHITAEGRDVIIIVPTVDMKGNFSMGDEVRFTFRGNVAHVFSKETDRNLEF